MPQYTTVAKLGSPRLYCISVPAAKTPKGKIMNSRLKNVLGFGIVLVMLVLSSLALAQGKQPNIVVIMGDDIGMWNIGAYHRGLMAGRTPNLDKIAAEG